MLNNPTLAAILGAIAGAIITSIGSYLVFKSTKKLKRIDVQIYDSKSLLNFSQDIADKLKVIYDGSDVNSIFLHTVEVIHTGNDAIENQPITIKLDSHSTIVSFDIQTFPEEEFGTIVHEIQGSQAKFIVSLLNPNDKIIFQLISINNKSDEIKVFAKHPNVIYRIYSKTKYEGILTRYGIDSESILWGAVSSLPIIGSLGRTILTVKIASSIEKISKKVEG